MITYPAATIIGLLIALFGPAVVAIADKKIPHAPNRIFPHLLGLSSLAAIVAGVIFIVFHYERRSLISLGIRNVTWQTVALGLALAVFFIFIFAPAATLLLKHLHLEGFDRDVSKTAALPLWYLSIAVLVGTVSEEVLYRGYAVERIAELSGNYWIAGIISVLLFSLAHVPMWGWGPALTTLISGAIFTIIFIWQRNLTSLILAHFVTDFAGLVILPQLAKRREI